MFWIALGISVFLIVATMVFIFVTRDSPLVDPDERAEVAASIMWPEAFYSSLTIITQVSSLILIGITGALVGQEYGWRTVGLWLSHGVARTTMLLARFTAVVLTVLAFTIAPLLIISPLTAAFTISISGDLDPGVVNAIELVLSILRTSYVVLPYLALTFLAGVLTRSTVGGIAVGALYMLLVEPLLMELLNLLGSAGEGARMLLPDMLATSVLMENRAIAQPPIPLPENLPALLPAWLAALFIWLYVLAMVGTALWVFQKQDLVL